MFPSDVQLTSANFWQVTLVVASLDLLFILLIWHLIPTCRYR